MYNGIVSLSLFSLFERSRNKIVDKRSCLRRRRSFLKEISTAARHGFAKINLKYCCFLVSRDSAVRGNSIIIFPPARYTEENIHRETRGRERKNKERENSFATTARDCTIDRRQRKRRSNEVFQRTRTDRNEQCSDGDVTSAWRNAMCAAYSPP